MDGTPEASQGEQNEGKLLGFWNELQKQLFPSSHSIESAFPEISALPKREHQNAQQIRDKVKALTAALDIVPSTEEGYVSMNEFLHPFGEYASLVASGLYYALLFFFDDLFSNSSAEEVDSETNRKINKAIPQILELLKNLSRNEDINQYLSNLLDQTNNTNYKTPDWLQTESALDDTIVQATVELLQDMQINNDNNISFAVTYILLNLYQENREHQRSDNDNAEGWMDRFIQSTLAHLQEVQSGAESKNLGDMSYDQYLEIRMQDSGMYTTLKLMEITLPSYIDWGTLKTGHPWLYGQLVEIQNTVILLDSLLNDLFSLPKEADAKSFVNAVPVLMYSQNMDLNEAIDQVIAEVNNRYNKFMSQKQDIEQHLNQLGNTQLAKSLGIYLQNLEATISATWHWELSETTRYMHHNHPFRELQHNPNGEEA